MKFKTISTQIKADDTQNVISGYGSVFGNVDSHNDIVEKGAFLKTIQERKNKIKMLWQHDIKEPIGRMIEMYEDQKGLFFSAKISQTEMGKKSLILMRDGVLDEMSIGYHTIKEKYDSKRNVNLLKEVKLYEISAVTFASNPLAELTDVKHMIKEYSYSKGNVLDIFVDVLIEKVKALNNKTEPDISTQIASKSLEDREIELLIEKIKSEKE